MTDVAAPAAPGHRNRVVEWVRSGLYLGQREVRLSLRTPAYLIPNLIMPIVFFLILIGSFSEFARAFNFNFKAFQLPVAVIFAVTGGSAGLNMVTDIESGYFDKLLLTPTSRLALLLGAMGADFMRIVLQGAFIVAIGVLVGTPIETGFAGAVALVAIASLWGLAYSAIGFAVALKTGNTQVVGTMWVFQFPFLFLAPTFAPKELLEGWLSTAATYNPMTYLLDGLRSLTMTGWDAGRLLIAVAIAVGFGAVTLSLAFRALQGRVR
ncbi:MAG TPA: ABC transporter permease [Actinomycetota bacterium]|nr:ABC transporter permease [Actinomycetota bacterium]